MCAYQVELEAVELVRAKHGVEAGPGIVRNEDIRVIGQQSHQRRAAA
jgi:hypothetical protein